MKVNNKVNNSNNDLLTILILVPAGTLPSRRKYVTLCISFLKNMYNLPSLFPVFMKIVFLNMKKKKKITCTNHLTSCRLYRETIKQIEL